MKSIMHSLVATVLTLSFHAIHAMQPADAMQPAPCEIHHKHTDSDGCHGFTSEESTPPVTCRKEHVADAPVVELNRPPLACRKPQPMPSKPMSTLIAQIEDLLEILDNVTPSTIVHFIYQTRAANVIISSHLLQTKTIKHGPDIEEIVPDFNVSIYFDDWKKAVKDDLIKLQDMYKGRGQFSSISIEARNIFFNHCCK